MQKRKLLIVIAFLLLPCGVSAEEGAVYKVVDENGKIRFTNQPSVIGKEPHAASEIEVKGARTNKSSVEQVGDNFFCGKIQLPKWPNEEGRRFSDNKRDFYEELARSKRNWESTIEAIEKQAHKFEDYSPMYRRSSDYSMHKKNNTPEKLEEARDCRCAIGWADEKQEQLSELEESLLLEISNNDKYIEMQSGTRDRSCGSEPIFNPAVNDFDIDRRRSAWKDCVAPHQELIDAALLERENFNRELALIYMAEKTAGKR